MPTLLYKRADMCVNMHITHVCRHVYSHVHSHAHIYRPRMFDSSPHGHPRPALPLLVIDVAIPLLMATVNALMCVLNLFASDTWDGQLKCVDRNCFVNLEAMGAYILAVLCLLGGVIGHRYGGKA